MDGADICKCTRSQFWSFEGDEETGIFAGLVKVENELICRVTYCIKDTYISDSISFAFWFISCSQSPDLL
jgi:hypothetical protein